MSHGSPALFNNRYGFDATAKKKALRFLTGPHVNRITTSAQLGLDSQAKIQIRQLSNTLDSLGENLLAALAGPIFGTTVEGLRRDQGVLLASTDQPGFGMLDMAQYSMSKPVNSDGEIVAPHGDPGIFAISFHSSMAGLQMRSGHKFVPVPLDTCVLWLGGAVRSLFIFFPIPLVLTCSHVLQALETPNGNQLKAGFHRVVADPQSLTYRFTMWYEVCVTDQVPSDVMLEGIKYTPAIGPAIPPNADRASIPLRLPLPG